MSDTFSFQISKCIATDRTKLFAAMLEPEVPKTLWGVNRITVIDEKPRTAYAEMQIHSENWNFTVSYRKIVENELLSWVVTFDRFPGKEVSVEVTLEANDGGTVVTVCQSNFDSPEERDANEQAWIGSLERLSSLFDVQSS